MKFSEFNLHPNILKGLEEAGFKECLDVQAETIPRVMEGRDVLVQSQTGTGKTAAFLIPLFQRMMERGHTERALIVAPTRELAVQIEKEASVLGKFTGLRTGCFYGGVGYSGQEKLLMDGVDIIIGTPGRLIDLNNRKSLILKDIGYMVIDEADRLFDMGFMPDLRKILKKLKPKSDRITMLFSATLSYQVKNLSSEYMKDPLEIQLSPDQVTVDNITQVLYHVNSKEKIFLTLGLLKKENPKNCIIFVNTKSAAYELAGRLNHNGYRCEFLMGDLDQKKRLKIIDDFKNERIPLLIATDVASRGLHIEDLELVINYDLPTDTESYVHRIGRTARVGKSGKAISFACEKFVYSLEPIEEYIKMKIPVAWADESLFAEDKSAGMSFRLNRSGIPTKPGKSGRRDDKGRTEGRDRKERRERPERKERHERYDRKEKPGRHEEHERKVPAAAAEHKRERKNFDKKRRVPGKENETRPGKTAETARPAQKHDRTIHGKGDIKQQGKELRKKKGRSLDERLEYYKSKYGEDFVPSNELIIEEKSRKDVSIFKKIARFFRKK